MFLIKIKMFNLFSKLNLSIIFLLFALFSFNAHAEDAATDNYGAYTTANAFSQDIYQINSASDVGNDLTKRMILGLLGKDALKDFLPTGTPDNVYEEINAWSDSDVIRYSRPFNSSIISGTLIIISSFFLVALFIMALYVIWLYVESLFRTQDSGEFLGNQWSKVFTPLKMIFGFGMILPVFGQSHSPFNKGATTEFGFQIGSFSMAQSAVLIFAGQSSNVANIIYGEFARSIPKFYPAIQMPDPATKMGETLKVLDFMLCRRAVSKDSIPITFNLRTNGNTNQYSVDVQSGRCSLQGNIGYDASTTKELQDNKELISIIGQVNYDSLQKEVIKKAVTRMLNDADAAAEKIIASDVNKSVVTDSFLFGRKSYNYPISGDDWKTTCDNFTNENTSNMNRDSALKYMEYSSKCLSYNLVKDLTNSSVDTNYIYGQDNFLKNKNLELCAKDTSEKTDLMTAKLNTNEKGLTSRSELVSDCVQRLCNASNLYECSSAINFAKSMVEKEELAKKGWMTAGAGLYRLMSGYDNKVAKTIINNTTFNSTETDSLPAGSKQYRDADALKGAVSDSFTVNLSEGKADYDFDKFRSLMDYKQDNFGSWHPPSQSFWDSIGGADGLFGVSKFQNCIENPSKIYNGYLCGNITEELHLFGAKLLAIGIEGKVISWATNVNKSMKERTTEGTIRSSAEKDVKGVLTSLMNGAVYATVIYLGIDTYRTSDGFTDIDQEIWGQGAEITGLMAIGLADYYLGRGDLQVLGEILNVVINTCLVMGIIFGFILPLLPLGIWLVALSGWLVLLLESLVIASIWAVTILAPSNSHHSEPAKRGAQIVISLLLRAPLLTIGLILAWMLNNILISELLQFSDIGSALSINKGTEGIIDQFVILGAYFIILYGMYSIVFTLIESFNSITLSLLFEGGSESSPFGKNRGENWQQSMSTASQLLERRAN